jgi:hypothetical protein
VLLALALCASGLADAQPYRRTVAGMSGQTTLCVTWNRRDFTYRVDAAGSARTPGDTEFAAIDASFASWQSVSNGCSDFRFIRGERLPDAGVGRGTEADNVLVFREVSCVDVVPLSDPCLAVGSCGNKHRCWDHNSGTIGLTTVTYSTRTGVAVDADIEFNAADFLFTAVASPPCQAGMEAPTCVAYDIQNTATHEIGHAVGFDHVDEVTSTMAPTAPLGETSKRVIDEGTALGFCVTYPRGQPPVPCDELAVQRSRIIAQNTGSFGVTCVSAVAPGLPLLALSLLTFRRRR